MAHEGTTPLTVAIPKIRRDLASWRSRYLDIARLVGVDEVQRRLELLEDVAQENVGAVAQA